MRYILSIFICLSIITQLNGDVERRAAIDVGSGGTKVSIADVDNKTNQIIGVILDTSFPVQYQAYLDRSADGKFDLEIKQIGLETFAKIKEIADQYQVQKISAIATSAFRKAKNAKEFISEIENKTDIQVQIIPQKEEGEIAFFSALASGEFDPEKSVVWDIGTGSLQMTATSPRDNLTIHMGEQMGSVAFKNYIISQIQERDLEDTASPNPMSQEDLKAADTFARAFGRKADRIIKEKIRSGTVVGIGRLFYNSIRPLASKDGIITRKELRNFIRNSLSKTDEELENPFAHVDVPNCILVLGVMKSLHIQKITPIETTTTRGLLISPNYWIEKKKD